MSSLSFDAQQWPRKGTSYEKICCGKELAFLMLEKAKAQFEQKGTQSTNVLFMAEDTVHLIHMPSSSRKNERIAESNLVQKLALDYQAVGIGFVSEAWFIPGVSEDATVNTMELLGRDDKLEILLIRVSWKGEPSGSKAMQIVRERRNVRLVERSDLFTPDGMDGILLLKKKGENEMSKQMLHIPIPI